MLRDPKEFEARLERAHVVLLFTPELVTAHEPLAALEAAIPWIDVVQIRPKSLGDASSKAPGSARATHDWALRVLALDATLRSDVLVIVNDRVDVAAVLFERGVAGVHLGQDDMPPEHARALLGPHAILGLSTHTLDQVVAADEQPVDYLGFGPIHATRTKGYARGLGAEAAWIASEGARKPLFPIGGIDLENAAELARVGRAAVGSAILSADDPGAAARAIRSALTAVARHRR